MNKFFLSAIFLLAAATSGLLGSNVAIAQALAIQPDFEREQRWRAEVVPSVVVGDAIDLIVDGRKVLGLFAQGKPDRPAIVLVHGVGVHPDHSIIGNLRGTLNDLGYTTLSVQMPVLSKETTDAGLYEKVFTHSTARINAAAEFLAQHIGKDASGKIKRPIILLSHSMGSWMSNVYLQDTAAVPYSAWVCLSITGRIGSTGASRLPILDVQAENDIDPVKRGSWLRAIKVMSHPGSKRVEMAATNHFYDKKEAALIKEIDEFLAALKLP